MPVEIGPFSKMPSKFFGSGTAAELGNSAALFYLALCEHANRNNGNTFKASDLALASDTGMGERSFSTFRQKLLKKGLISCQRDKGQSFTYTLQPQDLLWGGGIGERPRQKRKARGRQSPKVKFPNNPTQSAAPNIREKLADLSDRDMVNMFPAPANFARPYSRKVS
jgi:hypothetical protein